MNKRIMPILIFLSLVMPSMRCDEQKSNSWKQKAKDVVSAVCAKMPSKKKCLMIASGITSAAVTIGVLWKYTDVFNWICSKNNAENTGTNVTNNNDQTTKDKKIELEQSEEKKDEESKENVEIKDNQAQDKEKSVFDEFFENKKLDQDDQVWPGL